MPVYFVAQLLPAHVLDLIVQHMPLVSPAANPVTQQPLPPRGPQILIPLLQVCRTWRSAACVVFYSEAAIMLESSHVHEFENKKITYVNNAVACGHQHCVKRVTLVVSMGNFNAEWDSHIPNLASIISNCGILRSVKTVTYYFVFGYPLANGDYVVPESAQRFNAKCMSKNIDAFVAAVRNTMPNIQNVHTYNLPMYSLPASMAQIAQKTMDSLTRIISISPAHLSLAHIDITKDIATSPVTASLQSIALSSYQGHALETALIQRNALTLEKLCIESTTPSACLLLTWDTESGLDSMIYPRLKHLVFRWVTGQRDAENRQPTTNPFPRLETLCCNGSFPFTASCILIGCRPYLRHLDIEVDNPLLAIFDQANVFAKGAFASLSYMSLRWTIRFYGNNYDFNSLVYKSAELGGCIQTLCLRWMDLKNVDQIVTEVQFPLTLRNLDLSYTMLNIDQVLAFLIACPQVVKAKLSLKDITGCGSAMPGSKLLKRYQDKYGGCAARARYIGICSWSFRGIRQAAEFILLLIDLVPSIARVCIACKVLSSRGKFFKGIGMARKRSAYNEHTWLDDAQISFDDFC